MELYLRAISGSKKNRTYDSESSLPNCFRKIRCRSMVSPHVSTWQLLCRLLDHIASRLTSMIEVINLYEAVGACLAQLYHLTTQAY
jgi:hypothetical protein